MNRSLKKNILFITLCALSSYQACAQNTPTQLPELRYNSQINAADFIITQERRGNWAVNCRQRIRPHIGEKRCSATDGQQILNFTESNSVHNIQPPVTKAEGKPTKPPTNIRATEAADSQITTRDKTDAHKGYVLQLAAFSSKSTAEKFRATYQGIPSRIIYTSIQNISMFNVITPIIEDKDQAEAQAEAVAAVLGYLPWIRKTATLKNK